MNIEKYLKNKELKISNDDFDMEAMQKDFVKGYTKNSDIEKPDYSGYVKKEDFDKLQTDYTTMENNYNTTVKTLSDTNDKMTRISLENKLVKKGFDEKDFDDVIKIRSSVYADEKDDQKAIDNIAEKYKGTFFANKQQTPYTPAPNESGVNGGNNGSQAKDIKITRTTSIKDLFVPVTK